MWDLRMPGRAVCVGLFACSLAAFLLSPLGHHWPYVDLSVYRSGGRAVLNGAPLYDLRFPGDLAFTYPPLAALLFAPWTAVPLAVIKPLATAASVALLPALLRLALALEPVRSWLSGEQANRLALLAAGLALWLEPTWTTLRYGQLNMVIAALVLYDLSRPDRARWKGAAIGLATGLKLTPAIFAAYLLLTRRGRAARVSLVAFAATVAIGLALVPRQAVAFWGGDFLDPGRVGRVENAANQALRGALARLAHSLDVGAWWLGAAAVVGVAGLTLAVRAGRRGDDAQGFCLCALTGLLVSPVSWSHHWVLAIPALLLFVVAAYRHGSRMRLLVAAAAVAVGCSQVIWSVPIGQHRHAELYLDPLQQLRADAYVIIGVGVLAGAAWSQWRAARTDARQLGGVGRRLAGRQPVQRRHQLARP